jgi:hypothetical protein
MPTGLKTHSFSRSESKVLSPLTHRHALSLTGLCWWLALAALLLLAGCGNGTEPDGEPAGPAGTVSPTPTPVLEATPEAPRLDLVLAEEEVAVAPLPLRAGFPFTVTATIHNDSAVPAQDVPVMVYISAEQEQLGYSSFLQVLTVTVPASGSVPLAVPVEWNFAGGEHRLWVQVNRLPDAWQARLVTQPEADITNNIVLLDLMIDAFDAYSSDLCSDRLDVAISPTDVIPEPGQQRVLVQVHNLGNRAVYNVPVVVLGDGLTGIVYTPAIPPCGGTSQVYVQVDRPFREGEALTVLVNPEDWQDRLAEEETANNRATVTAGLAPGVAMPQTSGPGDYDFQILDEEIEIPQMWIVQVRVQNLGTRDADMVPIRIENEAGRKLLDSIPLVRGEGEGLAAFRVGYLWVPGGTLTFTINPPDAKGAYPEANQENNTATFTLP